MNTTLICLYCKKSFPRPRPRGSRKFKYCSRRCSGKAKSTQLLSQEGPIKLSWDEIRSAAAKYESGDSLSILAKKFGLAYKNMRKWLLKAGIKPRRTGGAGIPEKKRFWSRVEKSDNCWLWCGAKQRGGYGVMMRGKKHCRASHISWELRFGPVPKGLWVLHKCDNPSCVRPEHLFLGTAKDNTQDMMKKNRNRCLADLNDPSRYARGEKHGQSKLSKNDVLKIRAMRTDERISYAKIAASFGVSYGAVYDVINGKSWTHV